MGPEISCFMLLLVFTMRTFTTFWGLGLRSTLSKRMGFYVNIRPRLSMLLLLLAGFKEVPQGYYDANSVHLV